MSRHSWSALLHYLPGRRSGAFWLSAHSTPITVLTGSDEKVLVGLPCTIQSHHERILSSSGSHGSRKRLHSPEAQHLSIPPTCLKITSHTSTHLQCFLHHHTKRQVETPLRNGLCFYLFQSGDCILGCQRAGDNRWCDLGSKNQRGDKGSSESEQRKIETPYGPLLTS